MPRNPFGSIHKHKVTRADGRKETVFDAIKRYTNREGKKDKKFARCYSNGEAAAALLRFQGEIENELAEPADPEHTFGELVDFYKDTYVKAPVYRDGQKIAGFKRNLTNLKTNLEILRDHFGQGTPVNAITYAAVYDFKVRYSAGDTFRGKPPAVSTINEKLALLRRLFYIAIQRRWIDTNPFRQGDPLIKKSAEVKRNRMLTFEEENRLLKACENHQIAYTDRRGRSYKRWVERDRLVPLIITAIDTAMRAGEIFRLEWWQVDFDNRVIYIKGEAAEKSKTGTGGVLPMSKRLFDLLAKMDEARIDKDPESKVFYQFEYKRSFNSACREAGIEDFQFRDLRSTAATRMVLAGSPESQVMKVTRHRQLKIFLEHYSNVDILNAQRIGENLTKFQRKQTAESNQRSNQKTVRKFKTR